MLNSFTELLLPDKGNSFLFDKNKTFGQGGTFGIARTNIEPGEMNLILEYNKMYLLYTILITIFK